MTPPPQDGWYFTFPSLRKNNLGLFINFNVGDWQVAQWIVWTNFDPCPELSNKCLTPHEGPTMFDTHLSPNLAAPYPIIIECTRVRSQQKYWSQLRVDVWDYMSSRIYGKCWNRSMDTSHTSSKSTVSLLTWFDMIYLQNI